MQGNLVRRIKCRYCNIFFVILERSFLLKLNLIEVAAWIPHEHCASGWEKEPTALLLKMAYGEVLTEGSWESYYFGKEICKGLLANSELGEILGFSIVSINF